jgi:spoIIIJ-associated protein
VAGTEDDNDDDIRDDDAESVEATGKTVEEATEDALDELGLERHEVTIEVLAEGRAGLFGIGGEPARVRVTPVSFEDPEGEDVAFAQETLETLLGLLEIEATVTMRAPETPGDGVGLMKAVLDVHGEDLGVLIGRRGSSLSSLQYLLNLIVSRRFKHNQPFAVDVEGYRRRREEALEDMAFQAAERVRRTGKPVTLEPMPPSERRIVHLSLSKDPTVSTSSVGQGDARKVSIHTLR